MNLKNIRKATYDKSAEAAAAAYIKSELDRGVQSVDLAAAPGRLIDQVRALRNLNALAH